MRNRLVSAGVLLIILIPLIIIGKIPFAIGVGVIGLLSLREIMMLYKCPMPVRALSLISLLLIVYSNFDINNIVLGLNYQYICIAFLLIMIPVIFYQTKNKYTTDIAFRVFSFIFMVGLGLNFFILIRNLDIKYLILVLGIPIITDTFAYVGGMLVGKHKITGISPNKSLEGYIIGSVVGTIIMVLYYNTFIAHQSSLLIVIGLIFLMSVIGQVGDLFFSAIKRTNNIKDFSKLLPGHGGMLDRLDSLIFVAMTFIIFIEYL